MPGSSREFGVPDSEPHAKAHVPLSDRFSPFKITTHTYKTVHGHAILVDVFVPSRLVDGTADVDGAASNRSRPLLVRIHGGWLIGGQRDHAPWCPLYTLELALQHNTIIVMPDYRLLPEATGHDILDDMDDFWAWVSKDGENGLRGAVRDATGGRIEVDLGRVLVEGESAGGYLAVQLVMSYHRIAFPRIRAMIAVYPMLDLRAPHWSQDYHKQLFDAPQYPMSIIDEHLESIAKAVARGRTPVTTNEPMDGTPRNEMAIAVVQRGRFLEILDPEVKSSPGSPNVRGRRLHPEDRLHDDATLTIPPSFLLHGTDDSGVPITGTDEFVRMVRARTGEGHVLYSRPPGDHGFENEMSIYDEDTAKAWLKEGLAFVTNEWLM